MPKFQFYILLSLILLQSSCRDRGKETNESTKQESSGTLFELLPQDETGIRFANNIEETPEENIFTYEYIYNGSGVSIGDINNDGLPDVYLTSNQGKSKLFLNKGNFKFEDISAAAGVDADPWCTGVQMVDINNDGWLDIYVNKSSPFKKPEERENLLFINNGDLTFTESGKAYGVNDNGLTICAAFFDANNDGHLDLYTGNHPLTFNAEIRTGNAWASGPDYAQNRLYLNNGKGRFSDITLKAGMPNSTHTLSIVPFDVNNDGKTDLFVGNDYYWPDFVYVNQGNNTFKEERSKYLRNMTFSTMGVDIADYNNDGYFDLMALDMLPEDNYNRKLRTGPPNYDKFLIVLGKKYGHQVVKNVLQRNNGDGTYSDVANMMGIEATDWSWSVLMADFDNDGWRDIHITNGYLRDNTNQDFINFQAGMTQMGSDKERYERLISKLPSIKVPNYAYRSINGKDFEDVSAKWGLNHLGISNGAAYGDLDGDGDLDLIVCNYNEPVSVYRNRQQEINRQNTLRIKLEGIESNRMGLGAVVKVYAGDLVLSERFNVYRGYQSSQEPILHFGLGDRQADSLTIEWPSGAFQFIKNPTINKILEVKEDNNYRKTITNKASAYFAQENSLFQPPFIHNELEWIDFKVSFLIPHKQTLQGPGMSVADVNGDGLDDVFISGAIGSKSVLYLQQSSGVMKASPQQPWNKDENIEVTGVLFFDADGDGDEDLYLVGGSYQHADSMDSGYRDRLYINNGNGTFTEGKNKIPDMSGSRGPIISADIDGDGDLDLFVGGRVLPQQYPLTPRSYLLRNDGGVFTDVTETWCPALKRPAMVNAALFTDVNQDGKPDLLMAGELMPIKLFLNTGKNFNDASSAWGLEGSNGLWNSITAGDFDGDGDIDYVLGNKGQNSQIRATPAQPFRIYVNDFDGNGILDPVCTYYLKGQEATLHSKPELTMQMRAYISKNFKEFEKFARADVSQILGKEAMNKAQIFKANILSSSVLINKGGTFVLRALPDEAQLAPVFGIHIEDYNRDGFQDLLLVGNSYAPMVEMGWDYSFNGLLLLGDGKGGFREVPARESGFLAPHDAKSLVYLRSGNQSYMLVGNNNNTLQSFRLKDGYKDYVRVPPGAAYAVYEQNGKQTKREVYRGQGYRSQSSGQWPKEGFKGWFTWDGKAINQLL